MHLENWAKIELVFAKNLHIVPSELDKLEFWRVEKLLEKYEEFIEEENKQHKDQQEQYEKQMKVSQSQNNFAQPKFDQNSFRIPTMNIPKY